MFLAQYPEAAEHGLPALQHYLDHGARHCDPHPRFDTEWYLSQNPEAGAKGTTPLQHYLDRHGRDWGLMIGHLAERIRGLRSDTALWTPTTIPTAEAGIVISAGGSLFKPLYSNLRVIREQGCDLPIDVWHLPGEFTRKQRTFLGSIAHLVEAGRTPFEGLSGRHEVHGFKAWMLSQSRFRRTLMLDVNSYPLQNPDRIFQSRRSCILWRDGPWKTCRDGLAALRGALDLIVHPYEFESGQLYVDKTAPGVIEILRFAAALNTLGRRLYAYVYGDKETYALAFDLLGERYSTAPEPAIHYMDSEDQGKVGVVQPWFDGSALFYHPFSANHLWWRYRDGWGEIDREAAQAEEQCR